MNFLEPELTSSYVIKGHGQSSGSISNRGGFEYERQARKGGEKKVGYCVERQTHNKPIGTKGSKKLVQVMG